MAQTAEEVGNAIMKRHEENLSLFLAFTQSHGMEDFEILLQRPDLLDIAVVSYFTNLVESGEFSLNFNTILVDLRSIFVIKSGDKSLDIEDPQQFPRICEFRCILNGTPLKQYHIANIFVLLQNLSKLMSPECVCSAPTFRQYLAKIPQKWHANYNALIQYGVMFLFQYQVINSIKLIEILKYELWC